MYRLIQAFHLTALRSQPWYPTQTRRWQQANASGYHARLVRDDVTKHIARKDHSIQAPWILHHHHSRRINQKMLQLHGRKLLFHYLPYCPSPEPSGGRQHICLVETRDPKGWVVLHGQDPGESGDPLDFVPVVAVGVGGIVGR